MITRFKFRFIEQCEWKLHIKNWSSMKKEFDVQVAVHRENVL